LFLSHFRAGAGSVTCRFRLDLAVPKHSSVIPRRLDRSEGPGYDGFERQETTVTLNAAAHPSPSQPFKAYAAANPALTAALVVAAIAAAALAGAWFFQLVIGLVPCELCLKQRFAYYLAVPLGVLVAILAAKQAPRGVVLAGLALLVLAALGNAGLGVYHAGVEWKFWAGPTECTGTIGNFGSAKDLLEQLDKVKVVRCDEVQWTLFGLSLAGYSVLVSLLMAVVGAWGLVSARRG
jgi:disulfide bond formation protein DsbB